MKEFVLQQRSKHKIAGDILGREDFSTFLNVLAKMGDTDSEPGDSGLCRRFASS